MKTLEIWWTQEGANNGIKALAMAYDEGWTCVNPLEWSQCGHWFARLEMAGDGCFILGFTG